MDRTEKQLQKRRDEWEEADAALDAEVQQLLQEQGEAARKEVRTPAGAGDRMPLCLTTLVSLQRMHLGSCTAIAACLLCKTSPLGCCGCR
jgi:hypothetical protein